MKLLLQSLSVVVGATSVMALVPRQSSQQMASVDLTVTRGKPEHGASGFIYGIPDNYPNQIPLHWYTDMGITSCKGGGAQLGAVGYRGWVVGLNDYKGRFQSTLTNYKTCRAAGAEFHIYVHDLWGTDHSNANTKWPGDNGNWTDYNKFVQQLMSDVAANMDVDHVVWDIWNEPDISIFWKRSTQQWVDMYIHTHKLIRANLALNAMKLSGPSLAYRPTTTNTWWAAWLKQISGNKTIPDYYTYHLEGETNDITNDPMYTNSSLRGLLRQNGLPERQVHINEYAKSSEMVPGSYIWYISRLERYDFLGMLGNWLGGTQLHDLFGGLLTKRSNPGNYTAADYAATPGYPIYKYYNLNMTGLRATTTASADGWFDTYATIANDKVRILAGTKLRKGTYTLTIRGLDAVGYTSSSGSAAVTTYLFDGSSNKMIAMGPVAKDTTNRSIAQNAITIAVNLTNDYAGWAFEFPVLARKST